MSRTYSFVTSAGEVEIVVNDRDNISAAGTLTVRGKEARCKTQFFLWSDGLWHQGQESENSYYQMQHFYPYEATPAFKGKAVEILTAAVNAWAKDNPKAMRQAEQDHVAAAIESRKDRIGAYQDAIAQIQDEIERIKQGEYLPTTTGVKV